MKAIVYIFTVLFILTSLSYSQHGREPDAWEYRENKLQPAGKVLKAMGVEPGMVVGEIGAGRGRYAVKIARKVGPEGKVYANDIDKERLDYLDYRCKRDSITNLYTVLGGLTDPRFPEKSLDIAFMINTYHHLDQPVELMRNITPGLKPTGILAIVEADPERRPEWKTHSTRKEKLIKQAGEAGFELVRVETFLYRDNIYIFRVKNNDTGK